MDEKKEKNKKISILFLVICFLAGIAVGFIGTKLVNDNREDKKEEKKDKKQETVKLEDEEVIAKLDRFIEVATTVNATEGIPELYKGIKDGLTERQKLELAYIAAVKVDKKVTNIPLPKEYLNDPYLSFYKDSIPTIKLEDLNNAYKELFNEEKDVAKEIEYSKSDEEVIGCPFVHTVDEKLGIALLSNECGGTMEATYYHKINAYREDEDYYYVNLSVGVEHGGKFYLILPENTEIDVPSFEGHENEFDTSIWKFDKNLNLVSIETYIGVDYVEN